MMEPDKIKQLIEAGLPETRAEVSGDGRHFQAVIVSPAFQGKPLLQRHRLVYSVLEQHIHSDELHALSMQTLTPEQWEAAQG
ncbi:MAG: BolA/IbaG family iron-sulfur metabolism protein [Ectothiorhodospiraceae bacterium]|nr:BolA/IbaG family iron-sulfur metabolism protein [Ectothiorhodospiraceae bacterium]MCH8503847.1 BolA/IbaG family iron-sulfur metabolism protein [Ectothiorhodospiraceae bacterium]